MKRQDAEKILSQYLKPIYGFALKRCKSEQDAEDLSQDIVMRAFKAMISKDDIENPAKFIWAVAHNTLCNYYRDSARSIIGVPIDEVSESLADPDSLSDRDNDDDTAGRLQKEIAYLSKQRRLIIIRYYFENKKQADIARELSIPEGTVKWHLFEAKKELKRGMEKMRKSSELKFNPIKFHSYGVNGSPGTRSIDEYLRSSLSQNICYCVRNKAKNIGEIADDLGVSPVYIESEAEFLEEHGLLKEKGGKYIAGFIISEPTSEILSMQNDMYKKAAKLFAEDLFDKLISSGILDDERIICSQTDKEISLKDSPRADRNFILWSLIPYIAACSGEELMESDVSFEEVATIRPDGGHNIIHASVLGDQVSLPADYVYMKNWCGPMWNSHGNNILWRIDSQWSAGVGRNGTSSYGDTGRVLSLFEREEMLSIDEYAWLAERGFVKTNGDYDGNFKASWQIVLLRDKEIREKLLSVGCEIKKKHKAEFDMLKKPYAKAVLDLLPAHMRRAREFELQYVFHSDGWFILHCITALLESGKLKEPTENQRRSLMTLIFPNE